MKNKRKNKYHSVNRSTTRLRYHILLAFKYRKNISSVIGKDSIKSLLDSAVGKCSGVKLHAIGVDSDHVHMVVSCPPYWSPSSIVERIKQLSTHRAWDKYGKKLSMIYYGKKRMLWSDGYFCETIGNMREDKVLSYVKNQGD